MRHLAGAKRPPSGEYDADIVILMLERATETIAALSSALNQRGIVRHVTILDQGSSQQAIAEVASAIGSNTEATLLGTGRNLGVAAGRNRASAFGHGRAIIGLDNDAVFASRDSAAAAVRALAATPDLAAIGFRILAADGATDDPLCWGYPRGLLHAARETFEAATFVGAGHAIRRSAFEEAGGYDEALFFCWEEFDFCRRAIAAGWRIEYRGDIAIRHMVAPARRIAWRGGRWRYFVRNRLYIARKAGEGWPAILALAGGYAAKGAANGLLGDSVRAIAEATPLICRLRPARRVLPRTREYLRRADGRYRPPIWRRLFIEGLAKLPG
ncbi:MAG TPA: glycosyltransferase [Acetobacteraceae bacterium]|nr:glycosyltransferase [Acetobacteraceae bacterium]